MEVTVNIINEQVCNSRAVYNGIVTKNMLCAGHLTGGKDSCQVSSPHQMNMYTLCFCIKIQQTLQQNLR